MKTNTKNFITPFTLLPHSSLSLFGLIALLFFLLTNQASAATIAKPSNFLTINTGLVGYWTFDGPKMLSNVADSSGQGNHGNLVGQTATTSVQGKLGQALKFDGSDDYVDLGTGTQYNFADTTFTVSGWFKAPDATFGLMVTNTYNVGGWGIGYFGGLGCYAKSSSGADVPYEDTIASYDDDKWHQFVVVQTTSTSVAANNGCLIYIDGNLAPTTRTSNSNVYFVPATSYKRIGNRDTAGGVYPPYPFKGSLDDVRIYNRVLSVGEIRQLYNQGAATKVASSPLATSGAGLNSGLVGYWTFDGPKMLSNVADSSGQGNHGNLVGQTATTSVQGKLGQGLKFDGSDDYVNAGSGSSLRPSLPFSLSGWIYMNSVGTITRGIVGVGRDNTGGSGAEHRGYMLSVTPSGNLSLNYGDGTTCSATGRRSFTGSTVLSTGRWYHVAAVIQGPTNGQLYINGVGESVTLSGTGGTMVYGNDVSRIGTTADCPDGTTFSPFTGSLDDVRIYNRVLSATEVKQLYNQGAATKVASSPLATSGAGLNQGLVGYWTFDGPKMLSNVADSSGQGNHGSLVGQTATTSVQGKLGQALKFDGVDDYVDVGDTGLPSGSFTSSMWAKQTGYTATYQAPIFFYTTADAVNFQFNLNGSGSSANQWGYYIRDSSGAVVDNFNVTPTTALNTWYHLTATVNKTGSSCDAVLYVNGSAVRTTLGASCPGNFLSTATNRNIGSALSASEYFKGSIDDVRIYNRALSATEVQQLYNLGR